MPSFLFVLSTAILCGITAATTEVGQGHFRYATMYWRKTDDPMSNTVEIVIESAWRRSYSSDYFTEALENGETVLQINGAVTPTVSLGDGQQRYLDSVRVTAFSTAEDWLLGEQVITHSYSTPNHRGAPWTVEFTGCCRIDGGINRQDGSWHLSSSIDLLLSLYSPRTVSLPAVFVTAGEAVGVPLRISGAPPGSVTSFSLLSGEHASLSTQNGRTQIDVDGDAVLAAAGGAEYAIMHVTFAAVTADMGGHVLSSVASEMLLNVSESDHRPVFDPDTLSLFASPVVAVAGFELSLTLRAAQTHGTTDYVGYTVGVLPQGMRLSTVTGKGTSDEDKAEMKMTWTPCASSLGSSVLCLDAVNSQGLAATQRCLTIVVEMDHAPSLAVTLEGQSVANNSAPEQELYIGRRYHFMVTATDANPHDTLTVAAVSLPPDGVFLDASSHTDTHAVTARELVFAPKHNHGGYNTLHCFTASDSCGDSSACQHPCVGGVDVVTFCVSFRVRRCEYTVRGGEELSQIADIYHTDWLQLWSHNDHLLHPDDSLQPGALLHIGRPYDVQPYDTVEEVAKRFGMSHGALFTLNADIVTVTGGEASRAVCTSIKECEALGGGEAYQWCILPSSCTGEVSSIYA